MDTLIRCGKRGCNHCKPLRDFRPSNSERTAKKQRYFDELGVLIETHGLTPELHDRIDAVRPQKCVACRRIQKRSDIKETTLKGATRAYHHEIRKEPCIDCGRTDDASEFDHVVDGKTMNLGDHAWWAVNGGVEAMKKEKALCVPRCRNCHMLRDNMAIYNAKYANWGDMPDTTLAEHTAKWDKKQIHEKETYINGMKLRLGRCEECNLQVSENAYHIFVFAHKTARDKEYNMADLRRSRQSLATAKPLIDAEAERCRLLCQVCHSKETRDRNGNMTTEQVFAI